MRISDWSSDVCSSDLHDALLNELGQPVGEAVLDWQPRQAPPRTAMQGRFCRVEPLDPARHAEDLFAAYRADKEGRNWTYLPYGPFASLAAFGDWMEKRSEEHTSELQSLMRISYAV